MSKKMLENDQITKILFFSMYYDVTFSIDYDYSTIKLTRSTNLNISQCSIGHHLTRLKSQKSENFKFFKIIQKLIRI